MDASNSVEASSSKDAINSEDASNSMDASNILSFPYLFSCMAHLCVFLLKN